MRYLVEITRIDHRTGETRTWRDQRRYKTLGGAQRAACRWNSIMRPDGKTPTIETAGRVVSR